ncbi:hypothetical protein [Arcobacter peruensis]|uniref:hypothetical protein n=1 Tax=Arcobacter peruensis TaxID=2320140 RepID=UPI000F09388C|nr:hypothetical protein [Arcobacter peruensis]
MNNVLLSNEIIVFLFTQVILFILLAISFFYALFIIKKWDYSKTTQTQYKLEKRSYLVILIITFTMFIKIFLMPYFAYSIDLLSHIVPGAMCAAGVIDANEYGQPLFIFKVFLLFFIGIWMILNSLDLKEKTYPYTKKKFWFFIFIFALVIIELGLDILYLTNISTKEPVLCCSVIFGASSTGGQIPFNLSTPMLLVIFYLLYFLSVFVNLQKNIYLNIIINILFLYISYYAVTYFFGTYIYQLPTHQCPFCMLQREYSYIGYFIWGTLFLGTFFAFAFSSLKLIVNRSLDYTLKYSLIFNALFVFICTFYVLKYYLVNGVFL